MTVLYEISFFNFFTTDELHRKNNALTEATHRWFFKSFFFFGSRQRPFLYMNFSSLSFLYCMSVSSHWKKKLNIARWFHPTKYTNIACCLKLLPRSLVHLLYRIHVRTKYGKFTFKYRATLIWETIPKELTSLNSFAFKRNCKTSLLQNQW